MNPGFAVSVWSGGVFRPVEDSNHVVVTARHPESTNNSNEAAASDVHVVFSGGRIFGASPRRSAALSQNESADGAPSRHTLVVFGDPGSCGVGSVDAFEELYSSLVQIEDSWESRVSCNCHESFQGHREQHKQPHLTHGPSAAAGATSHGVAPALSNGVSDASTSELLKALGPRRAAYASRISAALSGRCRWRCQFDRQSCGVARPACNSIPAAAFTSPSAAFCLAFYSETFGLLFFCRDKLGLASLLAVAQGKGPDERRPRFVLATSAADLRSVDPQSWLGKGAEERAIEVPVDGVWLLDLWAIAAPAKNGINNVPVAEAQASFAAAFTPFESTDESDNCSASLLALPSVYCIPWEQPSILRTTHMWCACAICARYRGQFWQGSDSQCCLPLGTHECVLPQEIDQSLRKLLGCRLELAGASSVPPALEEAVFLGAVQEGGSYLSSAQVLKCLYRELFGAVARAIPEALQKIAATSGARAAPSASGAAPETVFVGLLFSGGVDSTLLAGMLLRVLAAAMAKTPPETSREHAHQAALPQQVVVVELVSVSFSAEAPDRLTALRSFQDVLGVLHSLGECHKSQSCRTEAGVTPSNNSVAVIGDWALEVRLVAVDVASTDSANCRSQLLEVIYPKRSHMDFNIAAPLYFSSRGIGYLVSPNFDKTDEWQQLRKEASRAFQADPHTHACDEIHVGGQGRLRISDLGIDVHTACPVHRKPRLLCSREDAGDEGGTDAYVGGLSRPGGAVAPFKSLSLLPCGVHLATSDAGRPFMAMQLAHLYEWCTLDERRWRCVDRVTGTYTVQSTILLMGSGADEIFGGYGRHRTANLTKGWEALRDEQILDLRRLWLRNLGRDCRAVSAFGRWARLPFLDEQLLKFVCCSVPFEHIVRPSADVYAAAEEAMRCLLMKSIIPMHNASEEKLNCLSKSGGRTELVDVAQEPTMIPTDVCAAAGHGDNIQVEPAADNGDLCSGNKWLIRLCAAVCGLPFSAAAKKRAMQFGSRSAKVSNSEYFPSNRKARGDASLDSCDETPQF
ncbi:Asparagine synthetase domain-containing protein 1, related [Eimeria mitis]|uniref:Asparagine synthetase domain-containing protein 1, related n=1 Tax=Eimeria mitis TaxID=44415 RepID=U6KB56_9EIME|nr:Asparagine synthetase domain-containing protein 1, related [Eimeria mitis]CDJ35260.1 Asparagine synthetase domain-containing protein 1, related [Eimeria mitis]